MSLARSAVIVLLVALLAVDLGAANAAVAADRTVLNPGFVTTTLEEEGAYEAAEPIVLDQLPADDSTEGEAPPLPVDPQTVAAAAIDAEYVQSQVEPNIERTYAYLHGRTDELQLSIDLVPAKTAIADAVEDELTNASPTELVETVGGEEGDLTFEASGTTIELTTVAEMAEDESTFRAERRELRQTVRDRVVTAAVDEAFDRATNDDLLRLVIPDYDPDAYTEAEKEQLVADNEAAIREELREQIEAEDDGEIAAAVDERLAENREAVRANVSASMNESLGDLDPAVAEPVRDLALVAVDGYLADVTHDEFSAEFGAATDDLAAGMGVLVEDQLDEEIPNRVDLDEQLDAEAMRNLDQARQAVGWIDLLSVVLPLVGLGLIGGLFLLTRTVAVTAIGAGVGLALGGLPVLAGAALIPGWLRTAMANGQAPPAVAELGLAVVGQVADAVFLQSAVVVGVGVVALAAGLALHLGLVDVETTQDTATPSDEE